MHRLLVPIALLAFACDRKPAERLTAAASTAAAPSSAAVADMGTAPEPDVVLTLLGPGELEVTGSARLTSELRVERAAAPGQWQPLAQGQPFLLRASCDHTPAACTQLDRAHPLRVVRWPWSGLEIANQCPRTATGGLGLTGTSAWTETTVRFVATTCDGKGVVASPSFVAPPSNRMPSAERRWAADAMIAATAMRVNDSVPGADGAAAGDPMRIAGFTIRAGTEHTLDASARAALAAVLNDPKGYDDEIATRCRMSHLVGFRVTRTLPTTGPTTRSQVLELGIDFACNELFVVRGDTAPRTVHRSHFDPSRAAYLALVRRLFDTDPELAGLR